jgi:hypothetical protein
MNCTARHGERHAGFTHRADVGVNTVFSDTLVGDANGAAEVGTGVLLLWLWLRS